MNYARSGARAWERCLRTLPNAVNPQADEVNDKNMMCIPEDLKITPPDKLHRWSHHENQNYCDDHSSETRNAGECHIYHCLWKEKCQPDTISTKDTMLFLFVTRAQMLCHWVNSPCLGTAWDLAKNPPLFLDEIGWREQKQGIHLWPVGFCCIFQS